MVGACYPPARYASKNRQLELLVDTTNRDFPDSRVLPFTLPLLTHRTPVTTPRGHGHGRRPAPPRPVSASNAAKLFLLSTFLDDAYRMVTQWDTQVYHINTEWKSEPWVGNSFVIFNLVCQVGPRADKAAGSPSHPTS